MTPRPVRTALVTGAASGIGRACAVALARDGCRVAVSDLERSAEGLAETVRLVAAEGAEAFALPCDVRVPDDVARLVEATVARFGQLDVAVNNAGVGGRRARVAEMEEDEWARVLAVNLTGVWRCLKHELAAMEAQGGGGAIVNIASVMGLVGMEAAPAYVAAKHGVVGLTQSAALDYAAAGIRVNAVCPGFIATPLLERAGVLADAEATAALAAQHPLGRLGTAEEVAALVAWLCSEAASFVTGAAYTVDGGYTAQ